MSERSQYQRFGLVAQGQFGKVYCAFHRTTGDWVALKILDAQRSPTAGFLRELSTILTLNHPNLVKFYGVEHQPQKRCLVLDYCEGGTLRELLESSPQPALDVLLQLLIALLHGLEHAHQQGIIHCDVKPENVLLKLTSQGWQPKLTDFGIAQNEALPTKNFQGSPAYMAPEYFYGQTSPQTDVYAVGIVLYECLFGKRPFSGLPHQLRDAHLNQRLQLPRDIPARLQDILHQSLEKLPARRFASAAAMATALTVVRQAEFEGSAPRYARSTDSSLSMASVSAVPIFPPIIREPSSCPGALSLQTAHSLSQSFASWHHSDSDGVNAEWGGVAPDQSWAAWIEPEEEDGIQFSPVSMQLTQLVCCSAPETGRSCWTRPLRFPFPISPTAIVILNSRHGVLVGQSMIPTVEPSSSQFNEPRSTLILFNRRALTLAPLSLPSAITLCSRGSQPLSLLAIEQERPYILLKIALRPFQLKRVPLPFEPVAIAPFSWGTAVAERGGKLLLLDHSGEWLGYWQMTLPGRVVGLEAIGDKQLAIATSAVVKPEPLSTHAASPSSEDFVPEEERHTHTLNLQGLDLALVF